MAVSISGVLPIAHTPFLADDSIDHESFVRQIDWAFSLKARGCCTGMVSELLRLTYHERVELTQGLGRLCAGRGVAVAGVGAESTKQAVEYARVAEGAGCTAVMAIPPVATRLPAIEIYDYYATLAAATDLPVIVQDASGYVGQPLSHDICVRLLDRFGPERILFKPEANPLGPNLSALRRASQERARIFEGSGGIALIDSYRRGIDGTMPGMEFLSAIVAMWEALERGDERTAYRLHGPVCALVSLQLQAGLDGFLAIEKYLLHKQGLFATAKRRRPYGWEMDEETRREVDRLMEQLNHAMAESVGTQFAI